jgi:chromosome segregation protein
LGEDALGLKVYQYKIKESERKLEKTELNMKEVSMLRRENAPHLNFLKKQVEKLEKVKTMQEELVVLYREYLKKEDVYLDKEKNSLHEERKRLESELAEINKILSDEKNQNSTENNPKIEELRNIERKLNEIRTLKSEMGRKLGRIEGMIEAEEHRFNNVKEVASFSKEEVESFIEDIKRDVEEAYNKSSLEEIKNILSKIKDLLKSFGNTENHSEKERNLNEIANLKQTHGEILNDIKKLDTDEHGFIKQVEDLKLAINREMEALRDLEREKFAYKVKQQELSSALDMLSLRENSLRNRTEAFHNELKEGVSFVGQEILSYRNYEIPQGESQTQEELKRKIDRIKIKLEDSGMGNGAEIMKEFKEVSNRDEFLARELEDLGKSVETLRTMISDLKAKIDTEFKDGIKKINVEFQEFFSLMFGGGTGALSLVVENKKKRAVPEELEGEVSVDEEDEIVFEQGIEINVSLPHKKVKELHALSGGERSLTSIALLFAMSQVNPPPFLVLDETDAALDESNSRKYGDMLEKLSKHSELIVVTHNRETMSRAGMLYGVTIGSNGASKLLSIKFEEAAAIAK